MPRAKSTPDEQKRGQALGRAIRAERSRAELSCDRLARLADMPVVTLQCIEQGKRADPSFFRMLRVLSVLRVTAENFAAKYNLLSAARRAAGRSRHGP